MSKQTANLIEVFKDKASTLEFVKYAVNDSYADLGSDKDAEFFKDFCLSLFNQNVDTIFKYAGSEIEKIFLNSFLAITIKRSSWPVFFMAPFKGGLKSLEMARKSAGDFAKEFKGREKSTGLTGEELYDAFRMVVAKAFSDGDIDAEERKHWEQTITMHLATNGFNCCHIVLQPYFPDFKITAKAGIRPDLLAYFPLKKKINLIVELDGYKWHGDRNTFDKDRKRDRYLKRKGFDVLRYSGGEIVNNPIGAAVDLFDHLENINPKSFN